MNSKRTLPPLRALRAFLVVGKHLSIKDAAEELFLTASAVSHQIKYLEEYLDLPLLQRKTRSLEFTPAGQAYHDYLDGMFERLATVTHQLSAEYGRHMIRMSVPPFFASELLLPKLDQLQGLMPDTDIQILTQPNKLTEHPAEADLSILFGYSKTSKVKAQELFPCDLVVAASPKLAKKMNTSTYDCLNQQTLIVHENRANAWTEWSQAAKIPKIKPAKMIRFDTMSSVMEAVARGLGLGIIYLPLGMNWIESGKIVRLFEDSTYGESFYLACREEDTKREDIQKITDWLVKEFKIHS